MKELYESINELEQLKDAYIKVKTKLKGAQREYIK